MGSCSSSDTSPHRATSTEASWEPVGARNSVVGVDQVFRESTVSHHETEVCTGSGAARLLSGTFGLLARCPPGSHFPWSEPRPNIGHPQGPRGSGTATLWLNAAVPSCLIRRPFGTCGYPRCVERLWSRVADVLLWSTASTEFPAPTAPPLASETFNRWRHRARLVGQRRDGSWLLDPLTISTPSR